MKKSDVHDAAAYVHTNVQGEWCDYESGEHMVVIYVRQFAVYACVVVDAVVSTQCIRVRLSVLVVYAYVGVCAIDSMCNVCACVVFTVASVLMHAGVHVYAHVYIIVVACCAGGLAAPKASGPPPWARRRSDEAGSHASVSILWFVCTSCIACFRPRPVTAGAAKGTGTSRSRLLQQQLAHGVHVHACCSMQSLSLCFHICPV